MKYKNMKFQEYWHKEIIVIIPFMVLVVVLLTLIWLK